ncbi:hypothetical protein sphantq_00047 [Sphingobium sp. AntQ-1]|nr:hypothetical protein sphantq_00047 [Sphingobium sp. AntQ-1]
MADALFADAQAGQARHAAAMPVMDAIGATSALLAREARQAMIARLNGKEATR